MGMHICASHLLLVAALVFCLNWSKGILSTSTLGLFADKQGKTAAFNGVSMPANLY